MIKVAICDDEQIHIDKINSLLKDKISQYNLNITSYNNGESILEVLKTQEHFDIIFLDIEIGEKSGLNVAEYLHENSIDSIIIFITSHVSYVSDTFRLGAFQFLIKPINDIDFNKDFNRAIDLYKAKHEKYQIKWFSVSATVEYGKITYIESYNRHLFVHTNEQNYECVGKLAEQEEKLKVYNFVKCHQSFIVNLALIKQITDNEIIFNDGKTVPLSRKYKKSVLDSFNLYLVGVSI